MESRVESPDTVFDMVPDTVEAVENELPRHAAGLALSPYYLSAIDFEPGTFEILPFQVLYDFATGTRRVEIELLRVSIGLVL